MLILARAGRKRSPAKRRDPSGKIARPSSGDRQRAATATVLDARARIHGLTKDECHDQRAGYELGRLNMARILSDDEFRGAQAWAVLAGKFYAAYETGRPTPRAAMGGGGGGEPVPMEPKARRALLVAYDDACRAIDRAGRTARLAIFQVAIEDKAIPRGWVNGLKDGCAAAFRHLC